METPAIAPKIPVHPHEAWQKERDAIARLLGHYAKQGDMPERLKEMLEKLALDIKEGHLCKCPSTVPVTPVCVPPKPVFVCVYQDVCPDAHLEQSGQILL